MLINQDYWGSTYCKSRVQIKEKTTFPLQPKFCKFLLDLNALGATFCDGRKLFFMVEKKQM